MNSKKVFLSIILAAAIGACQKAPNEAQSSNEILKSPISSVVFGKWRGDCQVWGSGEYQTSGTPYFSFSETEAATVTEMFKGDGCSGELNGRMKMVFEFTVESQSSSAPEIYNILVSARKILQIFYDQDTVNASNTIAYCGFTDWVAGVEKDVSDRDCFTGPKLGEKIYSIIRISGGKLNLGQPDDANNGTSPSLRHKDIDSTKTFVKF
ncbi:MAG: hypothetical protein JNL11_12005 [Bdellovibrionaceae bacterium]|nr:hypothetical protein [Pseudobdellovibrionaceae bacterium]